MKMISSRSHIRLLLSTIFIILSTVNSFAIKDLHTKTMTDFALEASQWTPSSLRTAGIRTSMCANLPIVGGYLVAGGNGGASFTRIYSDLPSHNVAYIEITIYALDSWDLANAYDTDGDSFQVNIDTIPIFTDWTLYTYDPYAQPNPVGLTNICGSSTFFDNPPLYVKMTVPHNSASLTIKILDRLNSDSSDESLGFRDVTITLATVSSPTLSFCGAQSIPMFQPLKACTCSSSQYMKPPTSGDCFDCDPACTACSGSATSCSSCASGNFLVNSNACYSTCPSPLVKSASNTVCSKPCTGNYVYWDSSCASTCALPLVVKAVNTFDTCTFPCSSSSEHLYWNGTCAVSCPLPLKSVSLKGKLLCTYECSANEYLYFNGSCSSTCSAPFSARAQGGKLYCDYPCTGSNYLYWNGSCISQCDSSLLKPRIEGTARYCDFPCPVNHYLYWNGSCSAQCDYPLTQQVQGTNQARLFCLFKCGSGRYLNWNGACISSCPSPYVSVLINDKYFCNLPCDGTSPYYYPDRNTCSANCDTSSVEDYSKPYSQCKNMTSTSPSSSNASTETTTSSGLMDNLLGASNQPNVIILTAPFKLLQYIRYLDMQMPPRLAKFALSQGRSPLSVKSGVRMSQDLRANFALTPIAQIYKNQGFHSNFLVNYWEDLTTIMYGLTAAILLYFLRNLANRTKQRLLESILERLATIMKWNFIIIFLAYNVDDLILFTSIELGSFSNNTSTPGPTIIGLIINILIAGLTSSLFIIGCYIITKRRNLRLQVKPFGIQDSYSQFDSKWKAYQTFYRGFTDTYMSVRLFFLIYSLRIAISMLLVVSLTYSPIAITVCQTLINVAIIILLIVTRPFKKTINLIQTLIVEMLVFAVNVCTLKLVVLSLSGEVTSSTSVLLGDLVIVGNALINLVFIIFFVIRCFQEGSKIITDARSKAFKEAKDKTGLLQLLGLFVQQSSMGFEELIEDYPDKNNSSNPSSQDKHARKIINPITPLNGFAGANSLPKRELTLMNNSPTQIEGHTSIGIKRQSAHDNTKRDIPQQGDSTNPRKEAERPQLSDKTEDSNDPRQADRKPDDQKMNLLHVLRGTRHRGVSKQKL